MQANPFRVRLYVRQGCADSQRVKGADWRWSSATHDSMRSSDCCRLRAAGGTGFFSKNARMSAARSVEQKPPMLVQQQQQQQQKTAAPATTATTAAATATPRPQQRITLGGLLMVTH